MRKPKDIAMDLIFDPKLPYSAKPYALAAGTLDSIDQPYGDDSGRDILLYLYSNLQYYRGEKARSIKLELKELLGI